MWSADLGTYRSRNNGNGIVRYSCSGKCRFSTVALGHLDRNPDEYYLLKLADRGIYIQFDGPGKVKYYPDSIRVALIKSLISHGYADQLLISGDMGRASYLEGYGGGPGFRYIKTNLFQDFWTKGWMRT